MIKWVIKNPAPSGRAGLQWGDYHFGRSLTKQLTRRGHQVETHYKEAWSHATPCDVLLVLRGFYPFPDLAAQPARLRIMWNISHPADVVMSEYDSYDAVLVASRQWADELVRRASTPVYPLLQCTDVEQFVLPHNSGPRDRSGFVFVGNTRQIQRPGVMWALDYGLPLQIWGKGWDQWSISVVAPYFANEDLGLLYARSRATINDHWDDMKEFGFINNRILDALACGLPVLSDHHEELHSWFPHGVLYYRHKGEFAECVEKLLLAYPMVHDEAKEAAARVHEEFSFRRRIDELVSLIEGILT